MFTFLANIDRCSGISARLAPRFGMLRPFWAHLSCRPQFISYQPHVTQRKERHDLRGVFDQSFVPSLLIDELALDDAELMLNFGSDRGLKVFEFFDGVAHPFTLALNGFALGRLHGDMPGGFDMFGVFAFLNPGIASVTKDGFLFPMHQLVRLGDVVLVGRCGFNTGNQTRQSGFQKFGQVDKG